MAGGASLEGADAEHLIAFGLVMGALHVLMGADHLIALAVVTSPDVDDTARIRTGFGGEEDPTTSAEHTTRDVESSSSSSSGVGTPPTPPPPSISGAVSTTTTTRRHALKSFLLGLRWGFGHSLGLALVCVVFFATKRAANLDAIGDVADKLVGASMIVLGVWALYALHRWRERRLREAAHVADDDATGVGDAGIHRPFPPVAAARPEGDGFHGFHGDGAVRRTDLDLTRGPSLLGALVLEAGSAEHAAAHDLHLPHGKAATYLIAFLCASTLAMAAFAAGFGALTQRAVLAAAKEDEEEEGAKEAAAGAEEGCGDGGDGGASTSPPPPPPPRVSRATDRATRIAMGLNLFAGCLAIAIGVTWITLSSLGLLGDL
ncbi:uncharacterized protein MICPUCDRAFT_42738 [Micromonas pusilla CCMP1545]|uniref:Predicted protein n=1 Tax=Micromonas pusilla (strain CCMP1545) TaxID=564608 RepID=C1N5Y9_MICPC|nr:uncharacterized protein MICPUCDRAFT_42738 [Micromonas pusilla CCMP1545]EEH52582.1 predicted protein [Micromonas pusilla CCMP1545]|eukprot:XP_003063446.1 predicted protein [Micromonas pusilla CCMP1545]